MNDEQKKQYYTILVDLWRMFIKPRNLKPYSDEWWEEVITEYTSYSDKFKHSPMEDYCGELSIAFLNEFERCSKKER